MDTVSQLSAWHPHAVRVAMISIWCLLQAYIKAGAGEKGLGPLSVGFIVDKTIDL